MLVIIFTKYRKNPSRADTNFKVKADDFENIGQGHYMQHTLLCWGYN